jgi:imidazolonepropionase-like amidohydrolase
MKKSLLFLLISTVAPIFLLAQIAIKADIIYPVSTAPIKEGVILIENGKIKAVGKAVEISIPANYKIYESISKKL